MSDLYEEEAVKDPLKVLRKLQDAGGARKSPSPDSAEASRQRSLEHPSPVPIVLKERVYEVSAASKYAQAIPAVPVISVDGFRTWARKFDEAQLAEMDGPIQDFLRVVREDEDFPDTADQAPIVMYLQGERVERRVIDAALLSYRIYKKKG